MNIANLLARAAKMRTHAPAIFCGKTLVSDYGRLAQRAGAIGNALAQKLKIAPGERVAIFMSNIPEYLEVMYGIWYAGLAVVPINAKLHPTEVDYILQDSGASALFLSDDLATTIDWTAAAPTVRAVFIPGTQAYAELVAGTSMESPVFRPSDALAWLFYTSGTTGRPKGAMQTHQMLFALTSGYFMDLDHVVRADAAVYSAPMSHGAGMMNFPHMVAMARHVVPESRGFDAAEILELAATHRNVSMFAAPTMIKRMVDHIKSKCGDPSSFKTILYGGGPMYLEDIKEALQVIGHRFVQIFAQAESPMTITALWREHMDDCTHPRYEQRLASVGVARTLAEVRVADRDGNTLPVGEIGEVLVRGQTVMPGYWNNVTATAETIRDNWLFTGDMGSMDEDGFLTLKDRSKDMIVSGGTNIYPREVEEILLTHPLVDEVSVVGRHNAEWGEEVVAFVVTKPNARLTATELDTLCLEHIARFKRPREYLFIPVLPKNSAGKVLKRELRELLAREAKA